MNILDTIIVYKRKEVEEKSHYTRLNFWRQAFISQHKRYR